MQKSKEVLFYYIYIHKMDLYCFFLEKLINLKKKKKMFENCKFSNKIFSSLSNKIAIFICFC